MSDTFREMAKWIAFKSWADNASLDELKNYIDMPQTIKPAYKEEIRYIESLLDKLEYTR